MRKRVVTFGLLTMLAASSFAAFAVTRGSTNNASPQNNSCCVVGAACCTGNGACCAINRGETQACAMK